MLKREDLENFGSLITIKGKNQCLGDLLELHGKVFEPNHGRVPVTKREADKHNDALAHAHVEALDNTCEVGQEGYAYYTTEKGVTLFNGRVLDPSPSIRNRTIVFKRGTREFTGRLRGDSDSCNFRRTK